VKFEIKKGSFHIICSACWNLVLKSGYFKNKKSEIWQLFANLRNIFVWPFSQKNIGHCGKISPCPPTIPFPPSPQTGWFLRFKIMVMKKQRYPSSDKHTSVGRFSFFSRTTGFGLLRLYVRTGSVLSLFKKNRGLTRTVPSIRFFSRTKIWFSSLMVLSNSRTADFFGWFSQARSQKFQYSFWKLIFYIIIFHKK